MTARQPRLVEPRQTLWGYFDAGSRMYVSLRGRWSNVRYWQFSGDMLVRCVSAFGIKRTCPFAPVRCQKRAIHIPWEDNNRDGRNDVLTSRVIHRSLPKALVAM